MSRVILDISLSLDGYMTAANQTPEEPMGKGGQRLHEWAFGDDARDRAVLTGGIAGIAGDRRAAHLRRLGAVVGPGRPDRSRAAPGVRRVPQRARRDAGRRRLHFVTGGIEAALKQARAAAGDKDVTVMGGARTGQQFLAAGLVDELSLHVAPVLFGTGTRMFEHLAGGHVELEPIEVIHTPAAIHQRFRVLGRNRDARA